MKKTLKGKIVAGLAALAVSVTTPGLPMAVQAVHAEGMELPSETNTSFSKARELVFGASMAGTTTKNDSKRYYKFSLAEASKLELGVEGKNPRITIYDATQTEIYSTSGWWSFSVDAIYLTGGDYYMLIAQYDDVPFSFIANMDPMGESFTETQDYNNDMSSDASSISLKKKYKGVLAQNDDIDYYKFQSPAAGQITLNITNSTSDTVKYGVYDESLNPAYTNTVRRGEKVTQPVSVKSGSYYLAIAKEDVNKGTGSYTFSIDHKKKISAAPKLKSVKNVSSGRMAVTWGQVTGASGYELWYSTDPNFKGAVEKKELSASSSSAEYYGLTRKKTYYVKIRAYEEINGVKDYGKWSSKKSVKIKK